MKLKDLNPSFYRVGGEGISCAITHEPIPERLGMGICFDCPCGCKERVALAFRNPIAGGAPVKGHPSWQRTGDTYETLTLKPSIQRLGDCRWHGYLTKGIFKSV